jgi:1-acyl-sn-glycerol-3-phosphate acyltransferase
MAYLQHPGWSVATDYRSPPARPGLLARVWPSGYFYARLTAIVLRASWRARRGHYADRDWFNSSLAVLRLIERTGVPLAIEGLAQVAALDRPAVFIGNHMSTAETFILPSIIVPHRPVTYIVKRSLVEYPVFGSIMRSRDPIVVGRANPREDLRVVLEEGAARLAAGISVIVFPQRTRTVVFNPAEFNTIGVKLARRAQAPVVPLALYTEAWGNGRWLKDFGRFDPTLGPVRLAFGAPLSAAAGDRVVNDAVIAFITDHLRRWQVQESAAKRAQ